MISWVRCLLCIMRQVCGMWRGLIRCWGHTMFMHVISMNTTVKTYASRKQWSVHASWTNVRRACGSARAAVPATAERRMAISSAPGPALGTGSGPGSPGWPCSWAWSWARQGRGSESAAPTAQHPQNGRLWGCSNSTEPGKRSRCAHMQTCVISVYLSVWSLLGNRSNAEWPAKEAFPIDKYGVRWVFDFRPRENRGQIENSSRSSNYYIHSETNSRKSHARNIRTQMSSSQWETANDARHRSSNHKLQTTTFHDCEPEW